MSAQRVLSERTNRRVCLQSNMDMEDLVEVMREVIDKNHIKGSERGHKKERKDSIADDIKRKSQIEFDKKIVEIKERISVLTELL